MCYESDVLDNFSNSVSDQTELFWESFISVAMWCECESVGNLLNLSQYSKTPLVRTIYLVCNVLRISMCKKISGIHLSDRTELYSESFISIVMWCECQSVR